jgi:hypothetical protein
MVPKLGESQICVALNHILRHMFQQPEVLQQAAKDA